MSIQKVYLLLLSLVSFQSNVLAQYNYTLVNPGYRIQYQNEHQWRSYQNKAGQYFFTQGLDSICKYTVEQYPNISSQLEKESGLKNNGKINLVIYPSPYILFESNIGSNNPRKYSYPTISFEKNKRMLIAFDGSYETYTQDLRIVIMRNLWEANIGNRLINNSAVSTQQSWFQEGFIHYLGNGFSLSDNDNLFQLLIRQDSLDIDHFINQSLSQDANTLLAKGFCWFLTQHFRKDALKQIAFQLKHNKSVETALRLVTKRSWDELLVIYAAYLKHIYRLSDSSTDNAAISYNNFSELNPSTLLYSSQDSSQQVFEKIINGKKTVFLKNGKSTKKLSSFQSPLWLQAVNINYPISCFYNEKIYILNNIKGEHQVQIFNNKGRKIKNVELPPFIDGIKSFKVINENLWLFSAFTKGRSDIISFNPQRATLKTLTNDIADNIELEIESPTQITYRSGITVKHLKDSVPNTNDSSSKLYGKYRLNINASNIQDELIISDSSILATLTENFTSNVNTIPLYRQFWLQAFIRQKLLSDSLLKRAQIQKLKDEENPSFLNNMLQSSLPKSLKNDDNGPVFNSNNTKPYLLQLTNLWFNASVNNDYFINRLQPYQGQLGTYKFPEIGGMLTGGYADIFENHEFNIGYKMPSSTEGSDFFVRYKNKKNRTDWWIGYHRKVESLQPNSSSQWFDEDGRPYPFRAKIKSYNYEIGINHPLNFYAAINFTSAIRNDRTVFLSTDRYSLLFPELKKIWNINTINYTFNNIKHFNNSPIMQEGIYYKANLDIIFGIAKPSQFSYGFTQSANWYLPINKWINWNNFLSVGYSGGSEYILYNFGGLDNNVITRVDSTAVFDQNAPYIFQQLISPLRGFKQNTMWGNTYGILNSEIFAQIFEGIIPSKTNFRFINLMQIGTFVNIAYSKATWESSLGWERRNSMGLSLKTILASYPIRLDLAFPYNLGNKPMIHLSLKL